MDNSNSEHQNSILSKLLFNLNILLVFLIVIFFFAIYAKKQVTVMNLKEPKKVVVHKPKISNVAITGKAAYVFDLVNNNVLYEKNSSEQLPLASITKLMMALTASELLPSNTSITIRKEFLAEDGDSGLLANESWKLSDLLDFSLVVSSNDGARSIASVIGAMQLNSNDYNLGRKEFVKIMNTKAHELGLTKTYFVNEDGLDIGSTSGGYGSAMDVANLLKYIIIKKPEILEATKYKKILISSDDKSHVAQNTNTSIGEIPGLIASKTGYTDMAGGNLAVAFDASMGRPIIVVVLGSTQKERFNDVQALVAASLEQISK